MEKLQRMRKWAEAIKVFVFLIGLVLVLGMANQVLSLKEYPVGPNVNITISPYVLCEKVDGFYQKANNSLDVVFIGSSNVHCNVNPDEIWHEYGIASYDFTSDMQELGTSYYFLKQMFKTQSPKAVVIDVLEGGDVDEISALGAHFAFDHMKWDECKIAGIWNRTKSHRFEMFFPMTAYHERWKVLKKNDYLYKPKAKNILNGAFIYMPVMAFEEPVIPASEDIPYMELPERTERWLDLISGECKRHGCDCIFMKTPFAAYDEKKFSYFEAVNRYCSQRGIPFLYLNRMGTEIGLDYATDYADTDHMNWNGQRKLSSYIGKYLSERYNFTDKRKDEMYSEWNSDYERMKYHIDHFWTLYGNL